MQTRSRKPLNASTQSQRLTGEHGNNRYRGLQVKQEVTEKPVSLLEAAPVWVDPFRNRDYYYFCHVCNVEMPNLKVIMKHTKKQHPALAKRKKIIKYVNREPNVNHPKHFCRPCAHRFTRRENFRQHLKDCHYMVLKSNRGAVVPRQNDILPDWNDPRFYCPPCGRCYKTRIYFWRHCRQRHGVERPQKIVLPLKAQLPDFHDPNFFCRVCNVTLTSARKYRAHCHKQHQMNYQAPDPDSKVVNDTHCNLCDRMLGNANSFYTHVFIQHGVENEAAYLERIKLHPDVHDPDLYCCSCDMTLPDQRHFDDHMLSTHCLHKKPLPKDGPKPDPEDPNNHCRVCDVTYGSRTAYRAHIRRAHHMVLRRALLYDPNHFPDPKDPNAYCSVCKTQFVNTFRYRSHCRLVHRMTLPRLSKMNVNPDAIIDIHHPEFFCAKCNRHYRSRASFRAHLRYYHRMLLNSKEEPVVQTVPAEILVEDP